MYKNEPTICPAGNLIQEDLNIENDETDYQPKTKKKKTDNLNRFYTIMAEKEENRKKRHEELIEIQKKSNYKMLR